MTECSPKKTSLEADTVREPTAAARLSTHTLTALGAEIRVPNYDRAQLQPGIVHIGVGGFHRAHLATYADELAARGHTEWGIIGAGVLPSDARMAAALGGQDHLYTLITKAPDAATVEVIGSIVGFIDGHLDAAPLIEQIAAPTTHIVSMTVTEGGYPVDDRTGDYDPDSRVAGSSSAFGLVARGLDVRRLRDGATVTVLSCDNVMSNGHVARTALLGEAARLGPDLVRWILDHVSFPNSMVDRITPATSDEDRRWLAERCGVIDEWPVATEPFRQWVVEDAFAGERPPLEELDVIVTSDVKPYELMKLRLLNAGHSCIAYLAALEGIERVDDAIAHDEIRAYLQALLAREARPVLPPTPGIDLTAYIDSLVERFSNAQIGDQIGRLCLDGSAKFPKFLLPTIRAQLAADGPIACGAMALAGWCEYLVGAHTSAPLAADPMLDTARAHAESSVTDPGAFLEFAAVFEPALVDNDRFRREFVTSLESLRHEGVASSLQRVVG